MIHFCIPAGHPPTWDFTKSMIKLTDYLARKRIPSRLFDAANGDIYIARNYCVAPVSQGPYTSYKERQPFNGKLDYDFIMWIDTDMVFEPEDVMKLIENDVDVCSGIACVDRDSAALGYFSKTVDGEHYFSQLAIRKFDLQKNEIIDGFGEWLKDKQQENGLCEVDYAGGAFLCVKKGVYEKLGYPWYFTQVIEHGPVPIESSEDVSWCWRVKQAGYKIWADPKVLVGHDKRVLLRAF